jgi:hypothetical protein
MSNLYLIRNTTGIECEYYYTEKTDVWFLGDVQGYKILLHRLRSAITAKRNLHLWSLAKHECNMLLSILPPIIRKNKRPQMKFWERLVFYESKPWMELVISGNHSGYERFISELELFLKDSADDTSSHEHFDDQTSQRSWIKTRSISLNLRGPVKKWDVKKLQENGHDSFLERKLPETIPADLHWHFRQKNKRGKTTLVKYHKTNSYHEISKEESDGVWKQF